MQDTKSSAMRVAINTGKAQQPGFNIEQEIMQRSPNSKKRASPTRNSKKSSPYKSQSMINLQRVSNDQELDPEFLVRADMGLNFDDENLTLEGIAGMV